MLGKYTPVGLWLDKVELLCNPVKVASGGNSVLTFLKMGFNYMSLKIIFRS